MTERELFEAALELSDAAARQAYLNEACAGQPELRAQVEELLNSHMSAGSFLARPAARPESASSTEFDKTQGYTHESAQNGDELSVDFLTPSDKPGSLGRLAHYEVHEVLGHGAFGIVLKAFDEKLHRMVAIKVLSPELATTSPPRKRFLREARAAAAIRHENVVAVHAVEEQPFPYLVMEYIPGITLERALNENGPLEVPDVLRLGQQIACGLAAAHAQGLIHRDIKPSNILLENGLAGKVKISDFGLARAADDASMTQSGIIAGTPMYMSPEQATSGMIDVRSDLFSLGSVLYVMTSGRPPFRAANTLAVLKRVVDDAPRPIREIIRDVPDWLCAIIAKLQNKKPDDRFTTAQEVANLLGSCLADLQSNRPVTLPGNVELSSPLLSSPQPVIPLSDSERSRPNRPVPRPGSGTASRRWMAIATVALLAAVSLGVTELTGVTKLLPTVIHSQAAKTGTLAIEVDAPGFYVTVTPRKGGWESLGHIGMVSGKDQFVLEPGEYRLTEFNFGTEVSQRLVTIKRGETAVAQFTMESAQRDKPLAIPGIDFAAERQVAEFVLSKNGNVGISDGSRNLTFGPGTALPQANFFITSIDVRQDMTDAEFSQLKYARRLERLSFDSHEVAIQGLHALAELPIKELEFWSTRIEYADLPVLAADFPRLTRLTLRQLAGERGTGFAPLVSLPHLVTLELDATQVMAEASELSMLPQLRTITISYQTTPVPAQAISTLNQISQVENLVLEYSRLETAVFDALAQNSTLESLRVSHCTIDDQSPIGDSHVEKLGSMSRLRRLEGHDSYPSDETLRKLSAALPSCRIQWNSLTFEPTMSDDPDRRAAEWVLSVGGTISIRNSTAERVVQPTQKLPADAFQLTEVTLDHNEKLKGTGLTQLKELTNLVKLRLDGSPLVDGDLAALAGLKNLVLLNLQATGITSCAVEHLQHLGKLEHLAIHHNSELNDDALEHLSKLTELKQLDLRGTQVGDRGLVSLKSLPNLAGIALIQTNISDRGLEIVATFPRLDYLQLQHTGVTDVGLEHLSKLSPLRCVVLASTAVTEAGVKRLAAALPDCEIQWDDGTIERRDPIDGWHGWPADAPKPAIAPFDAEQAKKHQDEWAKYLGVPVEYKNSLGMKFRLIPPGEFLMGSTEEAINITLDQTPDEAWAGNEIKSEGPPRKVVVEQPLYVGVIEVAKGLFERFSSATGYVTEAEARGIGGWAWDESAGKDVQKPEFTWKNAIYSPSSDHPAVFVTPRDAQSFGEWLGNEDGLKYRLPTEQDHEWACRAGTTSPWYCGDDPAALKDYEWIRLNTADHSHAMGGLKANPFGLFDMLGNVSEIALSADRHPYHRGGTTSFSPWLSRSASRYRHPDPAYAHARGGFRVVLSVDAVKQALKLSKPKQPADPAETVKPQPAELDLPHLKGQPFPTRTAATWEPGPKDDVIPGLIPRPAKLDGVARWQIETIAPRGKVGPIAMSPDGKFVACGLQALATQPLPCTVRLYDTETGDLVRLYSHPSGVGSISWHKDSRRFVTGGVDGKVRVWAIDGHKGSEWQAHQSHAYVTWAPDGTSLATHRLFIDNASDTTIRTWKPDGTAGPEHKLEAAGIENLVWSPDGKRLAVISNQSPLGPVAAHRTGHLIHLVESTMESSKLPENPDLRGLAWHPDSQRLAMLAIKHDAGSADGSVQLLNVTADVLSEWKFSLLGGSSGVQQLAWSPDGKILGAALYDFFGLWNADGTPAAALNETSGIGQPVERQVKLSLIWSPDSEHVLFSDSSVYRADGTDATHLMTKPWPIAGWTQDSQRVFVISPHHGLTRGRYDGTDYQDIFRGPLPNAPSQTHWIERGPYPWNQSTIQSRWHARSPAFLGPSTDSFRWWTLDGRPGPDLATRNQHFSPLVYNSNVSCSPNGTHIFQSFPAGLMIRDQHRVIGDRGFPFSLYGTPAWSPDGTRVACRTSDGIRIITLDSPDMVLLKDTKDTVHDWDWSPDGKWISTVEGLKIRFWKPDGTPESEFNTPEVILSADWHPDSHHVALRLRYSDVTQTYQLDGSPGLTFRAPFSFCSENAGWSSDGHFFVGSVRKDPYSVPSQLVGWNSEDGTTAWSTPLQNLHADRLGSIEWHSNGTHLMTQSEDRTCGVWNGRTGDLQFVIASPHQAEAFSFDAAGPLLHGNPTELDAWFRCVIEEPDGNVATLKPSEFLKEHTGFVAAGSWPDDGKPDDAERKAVARLLDIGCSVGISVGGISKRIKSLEDLPRERFSIVLVTGPLTDGDLVWMHRNRQTFEELFRVELTGGNNTDQGLKLLNDFPMLWSLAVNHPSKIGPGLKLPRLTTLSLVGNNVTDETISHLKAVQDLYELKLYSTAAITDESVDTLSRLPKLRLLNLNSTKITSHGIARLKMALPICIVEGP